MACDIHLSTLGISTITCGQHIDKESTWDSFIVECLKSIDSNSPYFTHTFTGCSEL